jgi:tRNA-binding EMAP/Myf-like protein
MLSMPKIVTAKIEEIKPHPTSSGLKICQVSDGHDRFQIVCGSTNIFTGMLTILAKEGAQLPSGLVIQKTTIRAVDSFGMICSPRELGLRSESGAVDLPPTTKVGIDWTSMGHGIISSTPWYKYDLVEQFFLNDDKKIYALHHYWKSTSPHSSPTDQLIGQTYFDSAKQIYHYQKLQG